MLPKDDARYRWIILIVMWGSQFALALASYGWGPLAPFLKNVMSLNSTQVGTLASTFYFASALSALPAGILVDRVGVRRGLLTWLGLTGFPLGILTFVYHIYPLFLTMAAFSGLGYGFGNPVASKGIYIWFDKKTRGTAFGIRFSAVAVGGAAAGLLLVSIAKMSGPFAALRTVFGMIMVMLVGAALLYRSPAGMENRSSVIVPESDRKGESRFKGLFRNKALVTVYSIAGVFGVAQGVVVTFFVLYLHEKLNYSVLGAGSFFTVMMVSGATGRIFWGVVSDRMFRGDRKPVLIIISVLAVVSLTVFNFWNSLWPQWLFVLVVIAVGASSWGWNGITFLLVAEMGSTTETATIIGLATTFSWIGLSLGPVAFGSITDHFGYFPAWMSLAVLCVFAVILSFFTPGLETKKQ
jgi:MFS transporter, ACS family, hexuronate transporter